MRWTLHADSQTEIAEVNPELLVDHDIFRFDVAMDDTESVAGPYCFEELYEDTMALKLRQPAGLARCHELVEVAAWDEWRDHDDFILPHDRLEQRQNILLACELIVDFDLVLNVDHEILLHDLLYRHALEDYNLLAEVVPCHRNHTDHAAPDQSPDLVVADLSIKAGLALSSKLSLLSLLFDDVL